MASDGTVIESGSFETTAPIFVGEGSVRVQIDAYESADSFVEDTFPVRVDLDDADVGSTITLSIDDVVASTLTVTQEDLTQGYIDATLSHVDAHGSTHDITSQLTLSDGTQSVVSDAYTVTITEAAPEVLSAPDIAIGVGPDAYEVRVDSLAITKFGTEIFRDEFDVGDPTWSSGSPASYTGSGFEEETDKLVLDSDDGFIPDDSTASIQYHRLNSNTVDGDGLGFELDDQFAATAVFCLLYTS